MKVKERKNTQKEMFEQENGDGTGPGTGHFGKFSELLEDAGVIGGAVCVGLVLFTLICSREFPDRLVENKYLMLIVLAAVPVLGLCWFRFEKRKGMQTRRAVLWMALGYLLLFAFQLFWVNSVYFYTDWDVGLMKFRVEGIVNGGSMADTSADVGYSIYPNNLLIFYVLCVLEKIGMLFSMAEPYHLCIYMSCFCVNIACFLGNLIMRKLTESTAIRGAYTLISTVTIVLSPWIIIPYSDTFGMPFALLGMWALLCLDRKYLKWVVTAFAAVIGYYVKPTCIFPLFAAFILYGIPYLRSWREKWRELLALVGASVFFWCGALLIPVWIQHTYFFQLRTEMRMPYTHYLMMGINDETNGAYYHNDFWFSQGYPDVESRKKGDMERFKKRLDKLVEERRLGEFVRKKALINFNDGTFDWGGEGVFFSDYVEHDNILWDWFLDTMVSGSEEVWGGQYGKHYAVYRTIMHTVWLFMLTGMVLAGADRTFHRKEKACMMVVLCGLMVFLMLFEARARYLFLYSPVFLILSLCGWESFFRRAERMARKRRAGDKSTGMRPCGENRPERD